jgi:hypothetical protein
VRVLICLEGLTEAGTASMMGHGHPLSWRWWVHPDPHTGTHGELLRCVLQYSVSDGELASCFTCGYAWKASRLPGRPT